MSELFNIYCDESCHLENDHQSVMILGALVCPESKKEEVTKRIKEIKEKYDLNRSCEIKWTSVSNAKIWFYKDLVDYFFDDDDLRFRAVIADKTKLNHSHYNQSHDDWYYKMYYYLINYLITPSCNYNVYLDIKDTRSAKKLAKLQGYVCNNKLDFNHNIIQRMQHIHSQESQLLQLCDLLIGAISYANRDLHSNQGKVTIVNRVKERSNYNLKKSTLIKEPKFNLFHWSGRE